MNTEELKLLPKSPFLVAMGDVRTMINIALGSLKELSAQAVVKYKAPGMRFLIGEILGCLGQAIRLSGIDPEQLSFK